MRRDGSKKHRMCRMAMTGTLGLILLLNLPVYAVGQENAEFELTALSGVGVGELGERIDRAARGGSFYGGWLLPGTHISAGARLALTNYGSEHNVDLAGYSDSAPAGVKYNYDLLQTHLVIRYQPRRSLLSPYFEALVGINYFFTEVYTGTGSRVPLIVGDAIFVVDENGSETLMSSVAPSVGLGGGLKVRLAGFGGSKNANRTPLSLFLDLQGRYLYGGTARYLRPGGLTLDGDRLVCESRRSRTDMFFCSLGLAVRGSFRNR